MAGSTPDHDDVPENLRTSSKANFLVTSYKCAWHEFKRPGPLALMKWKYQTNNSNIPTDKTVIFISIDSDCKGYIIMNEDSIR